MTMRQEKLANARRLAEPGDDTVDKIAPVSAKAFRDAMSRLAAAVNVVTTDGPAGRAGFTASAVCSVTDEPPMLLVCINRQASAYSAFADNDVLCVNVLGAEHQSVSNAFGGKTPMADRFAEAAWVAGEAGAPVLTGALAHFECRIDQRLAVGTHDVLFCEVLTMSSGDGRQCLLYFDRRYHQSTRLAS